MGGGRIAVACAALLALGGADASATVVVATGDASGTPGDPVVAATPKRGGFLIAYTSTVGDTDRKRIVVRHVDAAGRPVSEPVVVGEAAADRSAYAPRLAYDPVRDTFLVVWIDSAPLGFDAEYEAPPPGGQLRAQRLTAAGVPTRPAVTLANEARGLNSAAVAFDTARRRYAVAWTGPSGVHARLLDPSVRRVAGKPRLAGASATEDGRSRASGVVIGAAPHARTFLVGWVREGGRVDVPLARTLTSGDARVGRLRRLPVTRYDKVRFSHPDDLELAYDPRRRHFAFAWAEHTETADDDVIESIVVRRMTAGAERIGGERSFGGDTEGVWEPQLAYASRPDAFMAVWAWTEPLSAPLCTYTEIDGAPIAAGSWKPGPERQVSAGGPRGTRTGTSSGGGECYAQDHEPELAARADGSGWLAVFSRHPYLLAQPVEAR